MKKIIIFLFVLSSIYLISNKDEIIIPNKSIRFRIIANSNTKEDQEIKMKIKDDIIEEFSKNEMNNYDSTREYINDKIPLIKKIIEKYNVKYTLNYGINKFPQKYYKGISYSSGNYESLVITLNNGNGDNFWCVLYPPLCMIDEDNYSEIEYKSLVKTIFDKYK